MAILVTGGAGFIGSHVCEKLAQLGEEVVIVDSLINSTLDNVSGILSHGRACFYRVDVRFVDELCKVFKESSVDTVVHLAALTDVDESVREPSKYFDFNVNGTLSVLEACRLSDVGKVILASSAAVYGDAGETAVNESLRPKPMSPYATTKICGEALVETYSRLYGFKFSILRFFNVYGPRMFRSGYSGVIGEFIKRLFAREPLAIYGDGEQVRDFIYVEDAADAILKAIETPLNDVFNIASGKPTSINELARLLMDVAGIKCEVKYEAPKPGDIRFSLADISKAVEKLGWSPKTDLRVGLAFTVDWYRREVGG